VARLGISMRWWLALAFAAIAAVTAVAVAQVFSQRSESAFRARATDLAVGAAVGAADAVSRAARRGELDRELSAVADRRRVALFVFDGHGSLVTPARSRRVDVGDVPQLGAAVRAALEGNRFVTNLDEGRLTIVGLRLPPTSATRVGGPTLALQGDPVAGEPAVLVAYASRPDLAAELGIVRDKIVDAALVAVAIGAVVGLLVALLITRRLRRIAATAAAIESGSFETRLEPRFRDELGTLAVTIDRMRVRLRDSFARLESERDRLRRLLERLQEGVVTVDRDLRVEFVNESARRLLGTPDLEEGDALPGPWDDVSLHRLAAGLFVRDAPVAHARVASDDDDGVSMIVGLPARHDLEAAVLVLTDISERERRERAEREFVTNAAHELRNPLASITSAVEVLQGGAKEVPAERDRFLGNIERDAARLGRLTRALLLLARAQTRSEAPRFNPVELRPLLESVAAGLQPAEGVRVDVRCPDGLQALAEADLLEQALANLAANAGKHTAEGEIVLSARPLDAASVAVEVEDTGPGIPIAEQHRVFDRFYRGRRDAEGFGLGLAIVQQAVRALGGRVEISSAPGRGTTIRVVLPAAGARAA
jgi:signal transduction histidine kinase/HAMP domain-containing protein